MMLIYGSENGVVEKGLLTGVVFRMPGSGRKVKPTPWMKYQMGALHHALKMQAFDVINDDWPKAVFWEYFLELAASPPNGWHHQACAAEPLAEVVEHMIGKIRAERL